MARPTAPAPITACVKSALSEGVVDRVRWRGMGGVVVVRGRDWRRRFRERDLFMLDAFVL